MQPQIWRLPGRSAVQSWRGQLRCVWLRATVQGLTDGHDIPACEMQVQTKPEAPASSEASTVQAPLEPSTAGGPDVSLPSALEVVDGGSEGDKRGGSTSGISSGIRLENVCRGDALNGFQGCRVEQWLGRPLCVSSESGWADGTMVGLTCGCERAGVHDIQEPAGSYKLHVGGEEGRACGPRG